MIALWQFVGPEVTYLNFLTGQVTRVGTVEGWTADELLYFMATEGGDGPEGIQWGDRLLLLMAPITEKLPEVLHALAVPDAQ